MKVELNEGDIQRVADIVTEKIREVIIKAAVSDSHFEAMEEKGKEQAIRMYGDLNSNNGVHEVLERKVADICREDLRYVIRTELEELIGDNDKLQRLLFKYLLEGVIDKAKGLAYKVNCGDDDD